MNLISGPIPNREESEESKEDSDDEVDEVLVHSKTEEKNRIQGQG